MGLQTTDGIEILIHMGIDTVELTETAFEVFVKEGQTVTAGTKLASMDLAVVEKAGKEKTIMVVFTNSDKIETLEIPRFGKVQANEVVGTIHI